MSSPIQARMPVPTPRQIRHHAREFYGFIHFTINTFTDKEWGYGDEDPALFNPTEFDADQIVRTAKEAGMKGLILTCKHHDGFCLWQTKTTEHSVKNSPFRGGKGDVVREISDACRRAGIAFGTYLSPWDRNHPLYGTPEYVTQVYRPQLRELLTGYGELFEVWFDGANGGDGYYGGARETRKIDPKTYYHWDETWKIVRELQSNAVMFSDAGPDVRWIGNERGIAGDPCWATIHLGDMVPGVADQKQLNQGDRDGETWLIPECDVSIRPGWFWHASENDKVRSPKNLSDLYFQSVGRGATLLLNLTPDRRGRIPDTDIASLRAWKKHHDATFAHDLAAGATISAVKQDGVYTDKTIVLELPEPRTINVVRLREKLEYGQRVDTWELDARQDNNDWKTIATATAIGAQRLLRFPEVTTAQFRLRITKLATQQPALSEIAFFYEPALADETTSTTALPTLLKSVKSTLVNTKTILLDLGETLRPVHGVVYRPDTAAGQIVDQYIVLGSLDNKTWTKIAGGEFSNIRNNPLPQIVRWDRPEELCFVRFEAIRFAVGDHLAVGQVMLM